MPKQKRRSLPGALLILALIGSAIALGVYGNKLVTAGPRSSETAVPTETHTPTETPVSPTQSVGVNETVTTPPANSTQGTT